MFEDVCAQMLRSSYTVCLCEGNIARSGQLAHLQHGDDCAAAHTAAAAAGAPAAVSAASCTKNARFTEIAALQIEEDRPPCSMGDQNLAIGSQACRTELLHPQAVLSKKLAGHPRSQANPSARCSADALHRRKQPSPRACHRHIHRNSRSSSPTPCRRPGVVLPPPPPLPPPFRRTPAIGALLPSCPAPAAHLPPPWPPSLTCWPPCRGTLTQWRPPSRLPSEQLRSPVSCAA